MATVASRISIPTYQHTNPDRNFLRHFKNFTRGLSSSKVLDSPGNKTYCEGFVMFEEDMFLFRKVAYFSLVSQRVFYLFALFF